MDASEIEIQRTCNEREDGSVYRTLARKRGGILIQIMTNGNMESVLDVGARNGDTLMVVHDLAPTFRIVGVDIVPEFLDDLREAGIEAVEADATNLPFDDQSFDMVFSSHTLEHCLDAEKALRECFRVARLGVFLVVPIEDQKHFDDNLSHHFHAKNTADWWELYMLADPDRKFLPTLSRLTQYGDVEFLFMRIPV